MHVSPHFSRLIFRCTLSVIAIATIIVIVVVRIGMAIALIVLAVIIGAMLIFVLIIKILKVESNNCNDDVHMRLVVFAPLGRVIIRKAQGSELREP